jgi:hypothetical protein
VLYSSCHYDVFSKNNFKGKIQMKNLFKKYNKEKANFFVLGLRYETHQKAEKYFCTPVGAKVFASMGMGGVHYCTVESFGETIFAVVPDSADGYVFPIAHDLAEFFSLIAALEVTQLIDQIPLFPKNIFENALKDHLAYADAERTAELRKFTELFGVVPAKMPYETVMDLQNEIDLSEIEFSDEYYDVLGIERG